MKGKYALGVDVDGKTAGNKAQKDVSQIAEEFGYQTIRYRIAGGRIQQFFAKRRFRSGLRRIPQKSRLLFQYPFAGNLEQFVADFVEKRKDVELILLIHDLDILRNVRNEINIEREKKLLNHAAAIITHNDFMKAAIEKSMNSPENKKIISLELFDYLCEINNAEKEDSKNSIVIAGNLNKAKSGYVYRLGDSATELDYHLYGINYSEQNQKHVFYHGSFQPEELPDQLKRGFGLVWDGDELSCCSGSFGEYLKYNNPHKLSLYLAAEMPVVVWNQSAVKKLVEQEGLGLVVESLSDMEKQILSLSDEDYCKMKENAARIGQRVRTGYYTKKAFQSLEEGNE